MAADSGGSSDVKTIGILMNVTEPLETLRRLLESQLHCSLDKFEFWLQDTMKVRQVILLCLCFLC